MTKAIKILLIVVLSILVIGLLGIMIFFIAGKRKFNFNFGFSSDASTTLVLEEVYSSNKDISIDAVAAKIDVKINEKDEIKVLIYSDSNIKNEVTDKGTELDISSKKVKDNGFHSNEKIAKIEIYVPINYSNELNINANVGDIDIDKLKGKVNIKSDVGNINIKEANKVDIEANLGDVDIDKVNIAEIELDLGNLDIESVNEYMDISADCGDVKIENVNLTKDSDIEADLGDIKIENISNIYIDAKTDVGKVKINKNYRTADITLTIENDTGDIKVNN